MSQSLSRSVPGWPVSLHPSKTAGDSLLRHTHSHTHTQAHTISICHLDYFKVSRSTDFILKAVSGNGGDEHMHAEMSISPCLAEGKRKGEGSF